MKFSIENARKEIVEEEYTLDTKLHSMNPVENIEDLKPSAEGNIDIAISFARDTIAYVGTLNLIFGMTNDQLQISYLNENAQGSLWKVSIHYNSNNSFCFGISLST
jgi:hypothetical protein